jgi:hypothetical protein
MRVVEGHNDNNAPEGRPRTGYGALVGMIFSRRVAPQDVASSDTLFRLFTPTPGASQRLRPPRNFSLSFLIKPTRAWLPVSRERRPREPFRSAPSEIYAFW